MDRPRKEASSLQMAHFSRPYLFFPPSYLSSVRASGRVKNEPDRFTMHDPDSVLVEDDASQPIKGLGMGEKPLRRCGRGPSRRLPFWGAPRHGNRLDYHAVRSLVKIREDDDQARLVDARGRQSRR